MSLNACLNTRVCGFSHLVSDTDLSQSLALDTLASRSANSPQFASDEASSPDLRRKGNGDHLSHVCFSVHGTMMFIFKQQFELRFVGIPHGKLISYRPGLDAAFQGNPNHC